MTTDLLRPARATITVGAAALLAILGGCSSTDSATTAPAASATATSSMPAAPASTTKAKTAALADALSAAGAQCTASTKGQDCTLNGIKLTVSSGTWESDTALRRRACTEGYVNASYKVITDGRDIITTDFNSDHAVIIAALREHGADPREANYCP